MDSTAQQRQSCPGSQIATWKLQSVYSTRASRLVWVGLALATLPSGFGTDEEAVLHPPEKAQLRLQEQPHSTEGPNFRRDQVLRPFCIVDETTECEERVDHPSEMDILNRHACRLQSFRIGLIIIN